MCKCGNNLVPGGEQWCVCVRGGGGGGAPAALGTDLDASVQTKFTSFPLALFNSSSPLPQAHTAKHTANLNE